MNINIVTKSKNSDFSGHSEDAYKVSFFKKYKTFLNMLFLFSFFFSVPELIEQLGHSDSSITPVH